MLIGIVLGPGLIGTSDPFRVVALGIVLGLVGSFILYLALRTWDRRFN